MATGLKQGGTTDSDSDADLNPAEKLYKQETDFNAFAKHYHDTTADSSAEDANIEKANEVLADDAERGRSDLDEQEQAGDAESLYKQSSNTRAGRSSQKGFIKRLSFFGKKYGATSGIIGLILGGFGSASILLAPGALLINIEKALTNDGSDATRMNIIMRRAYMGSLFGGKACTGAAIKCKLTTMSDTQKKRWESLGWKLETAEDGGRHKIIKMTSPDNVEIRNAREFQQYSENTLEGRRHANRVLNVRAAYFQNSKFKKVLDKYDIVKSKRMKTSNEKEKSERTKAINQSFDENTGATNDEDRNSRLAKVRERVKESIRSKASSPASDAKGNVAKRSGLPGIGTVNSTIAVACGVYDATRIAIATTKAIWITDLIKFAFPFIQAAAQLEDQGNIEPEVVENLADRLTWYDNQKEINGQPNPKYNLTAMDSQGIKMAIYGDFAALTEFAKQYTTAYMTGQIVAKGSDTIALVQETLGGKDNVRKICQTNSAAGFVASTASLGRCAVGGPITATVCAAMGVAAVGGALAFGDDIIMWVVEQMTEDAIKAIANADLNSSLKGVDAGNALAAGVGLMLSTSSMGYGLRPAGGADGLQKVKNFISKTDEANYNYTTQIALDEAKENPFDVTNEYSFTGQIATAFNPYISGDETIFSKLLNGFAVVTSPLAKSSTASALFSQPSNMTLEENSAENRVSKNVDPDMEAIGALNDWSGRMIGITSDAVLTGASQQANGQGTMIEDSIDYMLRNKYIKEDGSVNDGKDDNPYKKYKEYCTEDRVDPLGTTTKSIMGEGNLFEQTTGINTHAEEDDKWYTGEKCIGKESGDQAMLDNFATYFNICESQFATAEGADNCWGATVTPAAATTSTGGNWVVPTSGQCTSGFGQRPGEFHKGIDLGAPAGTPIYAPTDMKVTFAGMGTNANGNNGYGNVVVATTTDGSNKDLRFGHMRDTPNVKAGDTVKKGTQIGVVGSTGQSTGPHLHFETWPAGGATTFVGAEDPVTILGQHGVQVQC